MNSSKEALDVSQEPLLTEYSSAIVVLSVDFFLFLHIFLKKQKILPESRLWSVDQRRMHAYTTHGQNQ